MYQNARQYSTYNALVRNVRVKLRRHIEIETNFTLQIHWRLVVSSTTIFLAVRAPLAIVFGNAPLSTRGPFVSISDAFVELRAFVTTDVPPVSGRVINRRVVLVSILV